jgi:putative membrane protein
MNTNTESKRMVEQGQSRLLQRFASSVSATISLTLVAAGLLLAAPGARAQTPVAAADQDFLLAAAQGGLTEVKLGELAAKKGTRDDVKAFGQMMVKDHSAINDDLKTLAAQKGVTLPTGLDVKHQAMLDKMTALPDADFDDAYISAMIKGHKKDAKAFKAEASDTKDPDIKSFLDKSTPIVQEHLEHVTAMKK